MPSDGYSELECCQQCGAINMCRCGLEQWYREQPGANGVEPECQCPLEESMATDWLPPECRCECSKCYVRGWIVECDCHDPATMSMDEVARAEYEDGEAASHRKEV